MDFKKQKTATKQLFIEGLTKENPKKSSILGLYARALI